MIDWLIKWILRPGDIRVTYGRVEGSSPLPHYQSGRYNET